MQSVYSPECLWYGGGMNVENVIYLGHFPKPRWVALPIRNMEWLCLLVVPVKVICLRRASDALMERVRPIICDCRISTPIQIEARPSNLESLLHSTGASKIHPWTPLHLSHELRLRFLYCVAVSVGLNPLWRRHTSHGWWIQVNKRKTAY